MHTPLTRRTTVLLALAMAGTLATAPAEAGGRYMGPPRAYYPGHWPHGRHNDYNGLWWIAGTSMLLYPFVAQPRPIVIEQPEPVIVPPTPAPQNWYYCDSAKAYYPYVESCAEGWRAIPAAPPATQAPVQAASGTWYYCDAAGAYYPYVQECPSGWRATPATSGSSTAPQGARQ